ncbi:hypothetical protein LMH87_011906 [Akanthomyces muscarius]|uniref:Uncharacterized protein n=1 Tax=Akanthomyces muscarius TaxID=2231603 RepID=A0A9W8ULH2_AKAMU|nr:hypothetical protein LMH87_011906 [Akanthomyces muscarius]KAJ4151191.1 hypothetical protein LMH87_011906 [Akanthomyces muscarius]
MVSQPDPTAHYSLQHRRGHSNSSAASAILPRHSGHASSRSKRYNRSHAGGDSYIPLNEFPVFTQSGDVEIIVRVGPLENRYLLHKEILTRCSGFFEASTSEEWSRARGPDPSTKPKFRQLAAGNEVACTLLLPQERGVGAMNWIPAVAMKILRCLFKRIRKVLITRSPHINPFLRPLGQGLAQALTPDL